ncbi:uncharacterized protein L3040_000120 [Drepanopeziza brunnea f. sp. 'multigermtubi']|uniref:Uncharacterized protein n=1 Tax=Marssonina brunnea f. sp. multigermtubi (strain MB_m1) TaxID=1072389 RepID=K1WNS3_MARBU|nr:uncharacterized protein MBM_07317 [Drepanopeziza brunnea f. sp. 'multigermtubi' MB_m1]EKD14596.1 hypothetical protein MBM_07317 [Drepanopeziza brunnea f. sp. 'multigermtubi' MB_m1]KAJ5053829.1 hypothetical protein L3040_000120 [Drepanopeziza brunnea f. sp. 'multigermtubi']
MSQNKSIRDFFRSQPPAPAPKAKTEAQAQAPPTPAPAPRFPKAALPAKLPSIRPSKVTLPSVPVQILSSAPKSSDQRGYTSSLSSPPSSSDEFASMFQKDVTSLPSLAANSFSDRVINDSDDQDSDSSLEDLSTLLAARRSSSASRPKTSGDRAKTPPRYQTRTNKFPVSPLTVLPKYKFDLKALIAHKESDDAAEASSKRFKAMLEMKNDEDVAMDGDARANHNALLESFVADGEEGYADKVNRALRRTEATVADPRWYFFETQAELGKPKRKPFPVASIPESWKSVLMDPEARHQTFLSGFAEDMVSLGQQLPDELFLWMLDEVTIESNAPLRTSYLNLFRQCTEQSQRLLTPDAIQRIFRRLGGTARTTSLKEAIRPVQRLADPYPSRDWAKLLSVIKFLGQAAEILNQSSRKYAISMLLRMSLDKMVFENTDIHDSMQQSIARLCYHIPDDIWNASCSQICKSLFTTTTEPSLRLQAIDSISSTTPRTHDLRRRLATSFFFNSLSYAKTHSHTLMSLDSVIDRLADPVFDTKPSTKYRDLAALLNLLDIAVDDGKSLSVDLTNKKVEEKYNKDVEELSATINSIMSGINTGGASNISRMEAKSLADNVSKRIAVTLRTKRKPKENWFDGKKEEDFEREKKGMAGFLAKNKVVLKGSGGGGERRSVRARNG